MPHPRAVRATLAVALALTAGASAGAVPSALAAPVPGEDVTYTKDADFDKGLLVNVNHDAPNNDQLQLNRSAGTFPFIWVALSVRCTIAKINTTTGQILGEYRTVSDTAACNQSSRTTVGIDGSVWVGHRGPGGVTHVGLAELNQCVDRDNSGTIETSTGYGDVKAWPGAGSVLADAQDECILHHVNTAAAGLPGDTRHMSIDGNNKLWVGDFNGGHRFIRIDGSTGAVETPARQFACGGYGGLIDGNGVIWSANGSTTGLLRWDPDAPNSPTNPRCIPINNYGLAVDGNGNIWVTDLFSTLRKLDSNGNVLFTGGHGAGNAQGLAVDDKGDVWVSSSLFCTFSCTVGHVKNNGTFVGNVPNPTGSGSTGVSIDAAGKPWTANLQSNTATRIDPTAGPLGCGGTGCGDGTHVGAADLTVSFPAGPGGRPLPSPYNYSDMTGAQLFSNTAPQGTWTVTQDSGFAGTEWGKVTWNTEPQGAVPPGSELTVQVRAADTEAGLGGQPFVAVPNGGQFNVPGRFIQVRVTFKPNDEGESPVLSDIRVEAPPRVALSVDDVTVVEGDTGLSPATPATFTVSLDKPSTRPVEVDFATADGSATQPADYVKSSGRLKFAPGETSREVTVDVVGDLDDEPTEEFTLNLSQPLNATIADGQGIGTILDDDRSGRFTCRATGLRLLGEHAVSNPPEDPCADDGDVLLGIPLGSGTVRAGAAAGSSSTNQTPDDLAATNPAPGDRAEADSEAAGVVIVVGLTTIRASLVRTHAEARCPARADGAAAGPPTLSGSAQLVGLSVNGRPIVIGNGYVRLPVGLGVLHINHQSTTANGITQRGLWFQNTVLPSSLDVVVAESKAGYVGNPCV